MKKDDLVKSLILIGLIAIVLGGVVLALVKVGTILTADIPLWLKFKLIFG